MWLLTFPSVTATGMSCSQQLLICPVSQAQQAPLALQVASIGHHQRHEACQVIHQVVAIHVRLTQPHISALDNLQTMTTAPERWQWQLAIQVSSSQYMTGSQTIVDSRLSNRHVRPRRPLAASPHHQGPKKGNGIWRQLSSTGQLNITEGIHFVAGLPFSLCKCVCVCVCHNVCVDV
jgi:hypothetical protein